MRIRPPLLVLAAAAALVAGACGTTGDPTDSPAPTATADVATPGAASLEPSPPEPTAVQPTITPLPVESIPAPSDDAPSGDPAGAAEDCSGSDDNRIFFASAAAALDWPVYCAALPSGWFVGSGEYRGAGGGRVEITYKGPDGAQFELHEGAFCSTSDGCVPPGVEAGDAPFGDRTGTLVALDDGGWAIVVDRGQPIAWLAIGRGLSESAFRAHAAALVLVED